MSATLEARTYEQIAEKLRPLMAEAVADLDRFDDDRIVQRLAELIPESDTGGESGVPDLLNALWGITTEVGYPDERVNLNMLFAVDSLRKVRTPEPGAQLRSLKEIAEDLRPFMQQAVDQGDSFDQDEIVQKLAELIPKSDTGDISCVPDLLTELDAIASSSDVGYTPRMLDELHLNMVFALDALRVSPTEDDAIVADVQAEVASAMEQKS